MLSIFKSKSLAASFMQNIELAKQYVQPKESTWQSRDRSGAYELNGIEMSHNGSHHPLSLSLKRFKSKSIPTGFTFNVRITPSGYFTFTYLEGSTGKVLYRTEPIKMYYVRNVKFYFKANRIRFSFCLDTPRLGVNFPVQDIAKKGMLYMNTETEFDRVVLLEVLSSFRITDHYVSRKLFWGFKICV